VPPVRVHCSVTASEKVSAPKSTETLSCMAVQVRIRVRIGRRSTTRSPFCQVRLIFPYAGPAATPAAAPLTVSTGSVHQPGIRRYSGNATLAGVLTVYVMVSPNGYAVSAVTVTSVPPATAAVTRDGPCRFAARPASGVAAHISST
jgi:hypothetical protein